MNDPASSLPARIGIEGGVGEDGLEHMRLQPYPELVHRGVIDVPTLVERMACAPARLFKLPGGTLRRGAAADVTVFDPDDEWTVDPARFLSKGRYSPYAGQTLRGRVALTVVDGRVIFQPAS